MAPQRIRRLIAALLRLALSLGLLTFFLARIDVGQALDVAANVRVSLLLTLLAFMLLGRALTAYRWFVLIGTQSRETSFTLVLKVIFVSGFLGAFLPGAVGIEAIRVTAMARHTSLASSFTTVLFDRLLGALSLCLVVLIALLAAPAEIASEEAALLTGVLFAGLLLGTAALLLPRTRELADSLLRLRGLRLLRPLATRLFDSVAGLRGHPRRIAWAAVLALVAQLGSIAEVMLAAATLRIDIAPLLFLLYVPLINIAILLPVSAAHGLGVREAAFVYLFGSQHLNPEAAFALSLLVSTCALLIQLPGAPYVAQIWRAKRRQSTPETDESGLVDPNAEAPPDP